MKANVVCFSNPIPKVYNILPPAIDELDEMIAFMYMGPCRPTSEDLKRTPLLVRLNKVRKALDWLKLNHIDYQDLVISEDNMASYMSKDNNMPVGYDYEELYTNKDGLSTAVNEDDGTVEGPCPFVHGLTGDQFANMSSKDKRAAALEHFHKGQKNVLFIGQDKAPQQTFNNPQLFPQMFPHLFLYGYGGVQNRLHKGRLSGINHKKWLLQYYDKQFQTDGIFPLIALLLFSK